MANCNCIYEEFCSMLNGEDIILPRPCEYFKDRSRFVELPCNIGDMVYVITYCRCGNPECYDKQHCYKKETVRTPKVLASKMVQQMGRKYQWKNFNERNWEWKPCGTICYRVYQKPFELKMLAEVGKTVFLSREEAEKALAEIGGSKYAEDEKKNHT